MYLNYKKPKNVLITKKQKNTMYLNYKKPKNVSLQNIQKCIFTKKWIASTQVESVSNLLQQIAYHNPYFHCQIIFVKMN